MHTYLSPRTVFVFKLQGCELRAFMPTRTISPSTCDFFLQYALICAVIVFVDCEPFVSVSSCTTFSTSSQTLSFVLSWRSGNVVPLYFPDAHCTSLRTPQRWLIEHGNSPLSWYQSWFEPHRHHHGCCYATDALADAATWMAGQRASRRTSRGDPQMKSGQQL